MTLCLCKVHLCIQIDKTRHYVVVLYIAIKYYLIKWDIMLTKLACKKQSKYHTGGHFKGAIVN